jgi:hypothetical protein
MAKKPGTNPKGEFACFNVVYEDDSQRSNRRVPSELLGGLDGDEPARGFIMEQDREIAEKSGRTPLAIKSISRVGAKKERAQNAVCAGSPRRAGQRKSRRRGQSPAVDLAFLDGRASPARASLPAGWRVG